MYQRKVCGHWETVQPHFFYCWSDVLINEQMKCIQGFLLLLLSDGMSCGFKHTESKEKLVADQSAVSVCGEKNIITSLRYLTASLGTCPFKVKTGPQQLSFCCVHVKSLYQCVLGPLLHTLLQITGDRFKSHTVLF